MKTSKTHSLSWQNKLISTALASVSLILGTPQLANATLPNITASNLSVSAGLATASQTGSNSAGTPESMTITATTPNTVLAWGNFSDNTTYGGALASNDTVYFNLPTGGAILNNITGTALAPTVLKGSIISNGNVFFLNPNGVVVGTGAVINAAGFYASTIPDATATSYFYSTGTLGVFNGIAQAPTTSSMPIYIQTGTTITTAVGNGQVSLASAYSGAGVSNNYGATITGIEVDSLNTNGNLTVLASGQNASVVIGTGTSGLTLSAGYPTGGGLLSGGTANITTNAGPVQINGPVSLAGNLVINTVGTTANTSAAISGNSGSSTSIFASGTVALTTNNASISVTSLTSTGAATLYAGTAGSVTITGDLGSGSIFGNTVTYNDTNVVARTLSQVTSYGLATLTANQGLTVSNLNSGGGINATSTLGTITIGSNATGAIASTINGNTMTITGNTGANLYNANLNVGSNVAQALVIRTNNVGYAGTLNSGNTQSAANIALTNVTINGNIDASNSVKGSINLTGVSVVSASAQSIVLNSGVVYGGSITLSGVTINAGYINALTNNTSVSNSITLNGVANNSKLTGNTDSYVTANGGISIAGYSTVASGVNFISANTLGSSGLTSGSVTTTGANSTFNGAITAVTGNGSITLTGLTMGGTSATVSSNTVSATVGSTVAGSYTAGTSTILNGITIQANSDLYVQTINDTGSSSANPAKQFISLSTTGNLNIPSLTEPKITLVATGNIAGGTVQSVTGNISGAQYISVSSGADVNTASILGGTIPGNNGTVVLTSTTGNVNLSSLSTGTLTVTATTGNINLINAAAVTANGVNFVAGNTITENTALSSIANTNIIIGVTNPSATFTAPTVNLPGLNNLPNITVVGAANNAYVVNTSSATTNIANGTNVTGNLSLVTAGPISIGANATDSVTVSGYTVLSTLNNSNTSGTAPISTAANTPNLVQGISALTYYSPVSIGTAAGTANIGQISVSAAGSGAAQVYPVTTINSLGVVNLGTIATGTLNINSSGIANTSGVVSTTNNFNATVGTGTISIGYGANNAGSVPVLNIVSASAVSLNSTVASTVYAGANNLSSVVLNETGGALTFQSAGTVGTVSAATSGGALTYTVPAGTTVGGSLSTLTGSITATSTNLGAVTFNLGNAAVNSTITNLGSFTLNNVIQQGGSGGLTVSANSNPSAASTLTLGSGINLNGTGAVTFSSGNLTSGAVYDNTSTAVTVNASTVPSVTFIGKTISVTNNANTLPTVAFTSNGSGSVSYTNNSSIVVGGLNLGTLYTGAVSITSVSGNITQNSTSFVDSSANAPLTFTASTTTANQGVVLGNTNGVLSSAKNIVTITASGNSTYVTNNDVYLGNVTIFPIVGYTPNATDAQLALGGTLTGNISQTGTSSVKVWGNVQVVSGAIGTATTPSINLNGPANNFGQLTISNSSGNAKIVEAATSSYAGITVTNMTANSTSGDIITATTNSAFAISGSSIFNAAGQISLTNPSNKLSANTGTGSTVTLNSGGNATINNIAAFTILGNGTYVGGNLSVTDPTLNAMIMDQSGISGIAVTGIASFLATAGSINLSGTNNSLGGLLTKSTGSNNVRVAGNLVLVPGSADAYGYFTSGGNITTSGSGGSSYTYLTLTTSLGSVTISNPMSITGSLTINAPLGTVNLAGLSASVDLKGTVTPTVTAATYIPPSP
jgi:hypothetical protein